MDIDTYLTFIDINSGLYDRSLMYKNFKCYKNLQTLEIADPIDLLTHTDYNDAAIVSFLARCVIDNAPKLKYLKISNCMAFEPEQMFLPSWSWSSTKLEYLYISLSETFQIHRVRRYINAIPYLKNVFFDTTQVHSLHKVASIEDEFSILFYMPRNTDVIGFVIDIDLARYIFTVIIFCELNKIMWFEENEKIRAIFIKNDYHYKKVVRIFKLFSLIKNPPFKVCHISLDHFPFDMVQDFKCVVTKLLKNNYIEFTEISNILEITVYLH